MSSLVDGAVGPIHKQIVELKGTIHGLVEESAACHGKAVATLEDRMGRCEINMETDRTLMESAVLQLESRLQKLEAQQKETLLFSTSTAATFAALRQEMAESANTVSDRLRRVDTEILSLRESWKGEAARIERNGQQSAGHATEILDRRIDEATASIAELRGQYSYLDGTIDSRMNELVTALEKLVSESGESTTTAMQSRMDVVCKDMDALRYDIDSSIEEQRCRVEEVAQLTKSNGQGIAKCHTDARQIRRKWIESTMRRIVRRMRTVAAAEAFDGWRHAVFAIRHTRVQMTKVAYAFSWTMIAIFFILYSPRIDENIIIFEQPRWLLGNENFKLN
eukprot:SAG31_NODE_1353_length_8663_cov_6.353690_1_plen_337_part_00